MKRPVILCIMDGYGIRHRHHGNAIFEAKKPNLDKFFKEYPYTEIAASGLAVGLPKGQMGNSEVGHLNLGAGRVVYQNLTLINRAIETGEFNHNPALLKAIDHALKYNSALHLMGLISDGGVHSSLEHVIATIKLAYLKGIKKLFLHAFMDGRDVNPQSGLSCLQTIQTCFDKLGIGEIADIHGRYYAMDRDKNLDRVDLSYRLMTLHEGPSFTSIDEFFPMMYEALPKTGMEASDEFIIPHYNAKVDGQIKDYDAIIHLNYRPDRAIELSTVITNPYFYQQGTVVKPNGTYQPPVILNHIEFTCMMKYADSVKGNIAFALPRIINCLGPYVADQGLSQLRIAETEKYAHVTFFFDATVNYDGVDAPELKNCRRVLIPSPKVATYDLMPEMSAYLVLEALIKELNKKDLDVVVVNFANCDMVGHTAVHDAVVKAVEVVDDCVGQLIRWCDQNQGILLVTADHGNAEEILDDEDHPFTAHTTNLVPFCINQKGLELAKTGKLSNVAPTILDLLGVKKPPQMSEDSLIIKE